MFSRFEFPRVLVGEPEPSSLTSLKLERRPWDWRPFACWWLNCTPLRALPDIVDMRGWRTDRRRSCLFLQGGLRSRGAVGRKLGSRCSLAAGSRGSSLCGATGKIKIPSTC